MSLRQQLNDAMKEAMKAKDAKRLATCGWCWRR